MRKNYFVQRPEAPQGRIKPSSETGRPISSDSTFPPNFDTMAPIMIPPKEHVYLESKWIPAVYYAESRIAPRLGRAELV